MTEPYWSWESCESLGSVISETVKGRNVLLIASSDLSHFHPYEKAVELDKIVLNHIERLDPLWLYQDLKKNRCEACGGVHPSVITAASAWSEPRWYEIPKLG
jgi:AmmeMemoRadiSam system protein B